MNLIIRPFSVPDCASLGDAIDNVCREGGWMATTRFKPTPAWEHALSHPDCESHRLFVAQAADRVVGWCRLFPVDGGAEPVRAELGIGLLKEYRFQGWGAALLDATVNDQIGRVEVVLTVHRDNAVARRLFTRYGFKAIGRAPDDCIAMTLGGNFDRPAEKRAFLTGVGGE